MVIKFIGFVIWENMRDEFDWMFKEIGYVNVYFLLFIFKSFFSCEVQYVEGFVKECVVIIYYCLMNDFNGNGVVVDLDVKLEEEFIVCFIFEIIIWDIYKDWINFYCDLFLLINQWANVVCWEMWICLFLCIIEFLWQEGYIVYVICEEVMEEVL